MELTEITLLKSAHFHDGTDRTLLLKSAHFHDGTDRTVYSQVYTLMMELTEPSTHKCALSWWNWQNRLLTSVHFDDGIDRNHSTHKCTLWWWNWQKSLYSQECTLMTELTELTLLTSVHFDNGTDRIPLLTSVHSDDDGTDRTFSTHKWALWWAALCW